MTFTGTRDTRYIFHYILYKLLLSVCFPANQNPSQKGSILHYENFTQKNEKIQIKTSDIFHISAQNIASGYSLEPLR